MLENTCLFHHKILCTSNLYILFNYLLVIIIYILLIIYLLVFYVPMSINFMVSCRRYNNYFWPLFIIAIFYLLDIINNSSPKLIFEHVFFLIFRHLFWELVPQVGSEASVLFIRDLIITSRVQHNLAVKILGVFPFNVRDVSERLLNQFEV